MNINLFGNITLVTGNTKSSKKYLVKELIKGLKYKDLTNHYLDSNSSYIPFNHAYDNLRGYRDIIIILELPTISNMRESYESIINNLKHEALLCHIGFILILKNDLLIENTINKKVYIFDRNNEYEKELPEWVMTTPDYIIQANKLNDNIQPIKYNSGILQSSVINTDDNKILIMNDIITDPFDYSYMHPLSSDSISYNPLWKTLKLRNISVEEFKKDAKITSITLNKLVSNKDVSLGILKKICKTLNCQFSDIMKYIPGFITIKKI